VLAVAAVAVFGAVLDATVLRRVIGQPQFALVMLTIGLAAMFRAFASITWGSEIYTLPTPFSAKATRIGGVAVSHEYVSIIVGTVLLCGALYAFFTFTRVGVAMQAASQNQLAAYYMGIPVKRMFSLVWAISAGVAAIAGVLRLQDLVRAGPGALPRLRPAQLVRRAAGRPARAAQPRAGIRGRHQPGLHLRAVRALRHGARRLHGPHQPGARRVPGDRRVRARLLHPRPRPAVGGVGGARRRHRGSRRRARRPARAAHDRRVPRDRDARLRVDHPGSLHAVGPRHGRPHGPAGGQGRALRRVLRRRRGVLPALPG